MTLADLSSIIGLPIEALVIVTIWTVIWKGLALWRAARLDSKVWFVLILLINTLGFLEILYIFLFSRIDLNVYSAGKNKKKSDEGLIDKKSSKESKKSKKSKKK
jgi:hypothetical protein